MTVTNSPKNPTNDSELAILARKMIKRMQISQKDVAVKIGVTTPTLSKMLNCRTPIKKYYSKIEMLFNTWRAAKINSLLSEIAALKKFET